jgi:glycosyltransferase involved in cell wall biosynthesis
MKIVWLCNFNNKLIDEVLNIKNGVESAPWISRMIDIFKKYCSYEIHIVAPHKSIKKHHYFENESIYYHFFPIKLLPGTLDYSTIFHYKTNFIYTKKQIRTIINRINPDLIHMFGFENPYYSSGIFQFQNTYPVIITVQGFASSQMLRLKGDNKKRVIIEQQIIKDFIYFGIRNDEMKNFISVINPNAKFFWHEIPITIPEYSPFQKEKIYDFVFFSRVCKEKGFEDLIKALSIIKRKNPNIYLCVIGQISNKYSEYVKKLINNLGLVENITIKGLLKSQQEVHQIASNAKISVLPTLADTIPGTILESMFMKIPCVSYNVGGISTLNMENETIKVCEKGNIEELTKNMEFLLNNKKYADDMAERAYL